MTSHQSIGASEHPADDDAVSALYRGLLENWNRRDAGGFAALFGEDGEAIGFDGSLMRGRAAIDAALAGIFAEHQTGAYVGMIQALRFLSPEVVVVRMPAGIVPAGEVDLNPALNALQSLVAVKHDGVWRIALYQNTPAQFHGRPEMAAQLTEELRRLL